MSRRLLFHILQITSSISKGSLLKLSDDLDVPLQGRGIVKYVQKDLCELQKYLQSSYLNSKV